MKLKTFLALSVVAFSFNNISNDAKRNADAVITASANSAAASAPVEDVLGNSSHRRWNISCLTNRAAE